MYCKVLILKSYQANVPCCVELSHVRVHTSKYLTSLMLQPPFCNVKEDPNITRCLYLFNRSLTLPLNMEPFMAWQQCRGPRCPHCDCIVHVLQDGVTIYFLLSLGHVMFSAVTEKLPPNVNAEIPRALLLMYISVIYQSHETRHVTAGAMLRHY